MRLRGIQRAFKDLAFRTPAARFLMPRYHYNFRPAQLGFLVSMLDEVRSVDGAVVEVGFRLRHDDLSTGTSRGPRQTQALCRDRHVRRVPRGRRRPRDPLRLLTRFRCHVISHSSLYWWAAWLAEKALPGVRVWAADLFPNPGTIRERWTRLEVMGPKTVQERRRS